MFDMITESQESTEMACKGNPRKGLVSEHSSIEEISRRAFLSRPQGPRVGATRITRAQAKGPPRGDIQATRGEAAIAIHQR